MKCILTVFALCLLIPSFAQHCPFDGSYLIAIKVVNKQGKMVKKTTTNFYLQEVDNKLADSCTSYPGIIAKQALTTKSYIKNCIERWNINGYGKDLIDRLTNTNVFTTSNLFVSLNQSEHTCTLIGKSETVYTNYIYLKRKFVITYTLNKKSVSVKVPKTAIYSLCKGSNDLENFKPIVIKLK
jgi:hypothetical protein